MNKTVLIFKHEVYRITSRFPFWLGTVGPLVICLLTIALSGGYLQNSPSANPSSEAMNTLETMLSEKEDPRPSGLVDHSQIVQNYPQEFPRQNWLNFTSEPAALAALNAGEISSYYLIPANYLASGRVDLYTEKFKLVASGDRTDEFEWLLAYNLLGGDENMLNAVLKPIKQLDKVSLAPPGTKPKSDLSDLSANMNLLSLNAFLLLAIMSNAGMLLNSLTKEKENRALEILLLSADPRALLTAKMLAHGLLGLLMTASFSFCGLFIQQQSLVMASLAPDSVPGLNIGLESFKSMDLTLLAWAILFFILGYLLYAMLMTSLGMLVPHLREIAQMTSLVLLPLMLPLFLFNLFMVKPNSPLPVLLSLFPLTAPSAMLLRMTLTNVPLWQIVFSLVLLAASAWWVISLTAKLFNAQTLLSGSTSQIIARWKKIFDD